MSDEHKVWSRDEFVAWMRAQDVRRTPATLWHRFTNWFFGKHDPNELSITAAREDEAQR